ncbi:MAG TPA: hypothetical protein VK789_08495 [Bryobacteraceae bacterium]|jgi:hypothetical protein|nr:hypothetical protein [Bryobacteraceae bacterium]
MHEVRATVPVERSAAIARIALETGIPNVNVSEVYVHGPETRRHVVSVEVPTPKARDFIDALLASPCFDGNDCSITSRELRAIVNRQSLAEITQPTVEPAPDVVEDLWQMSHVTPSYLGRAAGGAILMADGVIRDSPVEIVVAALILPFLSQVLAIGFGAWCGDWALTRKGALAVTTSALFAYSMGAMVAWLTGEAIRFHDFKSPLASFAISAVIGAAAGLSTADDAGRRYLIGVAAAVQFSVYPAWFGASSVTGLPGYGVLSIRFASFAINLVTMPAAALAAYALVGLHRVQLGRVVRFRLR